MTALEEFDAWMQQNQNSYINDFSVLIKKVPELVFADAPWPGHGDGATLSIILLCENGLELYRHLHIVLPQDLDKVQPEDLLKLYFDGHAMVACTTENEETLTFQKADDGTLVAIFEDKDIGHEVQEELLVPGDFIRYTESYFRSLRACG